MPALRGYKRNLNELGVDMAQSSAGLSTVRSRCALALIMMAVALTALLVCVGGSAYAQGYENTATARDGSGYIEGAVEGSSGLYYAKDAKQQHKVVAANSIAEADAYSFALTSTDEETAKAVTPAYSVEAGATGAFTLLVNPTDQQIADAMAAGKDKDFKADEAAKLAKRYLYAALVDPDDLKGTYNLTDTDLWELVNAEFAKLSDLDAKASFTGDKAKALNVLTTYAQSDAADQAADFKNLEVHLFLACGDSPQGMVNLISARFVETPVVAEGAKKISVPSWKAEGSTDVNVEEIYVDADGMMVMWPADATTGIELVKNGEATGQTAELTADSPTATFEDVRNDAACSFATSEPLDVIAYMWGGVESGFTIAAIDGAVAEDATITVGAEFYGLDGITPVAQGLPSSVKARVLVDGEEAAIVEPSSGNDWSASADITLPESGLISVAGQPIDGFDLVLTKGDTDGAYTLVYQEKGYIVPVAAIDQITGERVSGAGLRAAGTTEAGLATSVDLTTTADDDTMILPAGSFKLQQVTDPEGFTALGDASITIMADGEGAIAMAEETGASQESAVGNEDSINLMEDNGEKPVTIIKVDAEKFDALTDKNKVEGVAGAKFAITGTDSAGEAIEEKTLESTSAASGVTISLPAGSYTLTETEAPSGYIKGEDITFTVAEDGTVDAYDATLKMIVFKNTRTKVVVSKREKDKTDELAGALLVIKDKDGKDVVDGGLKWTTTTRKQAVRELAVGEYKLVEQSAPTGYDKAADIDFRMNDDGTVEVKNGDEWTKAENNEIVMYDAPNGILKTKSPVTKGASGSGSGLAKTGDEFGGLLALGIIALLGGALVLEGVILARRRRTND